MKIFLIAVLFATTCCSYCDDNNGMDFAPEDLDQSMTYEPRFAVFRRSKAKLPLVLSSWAQLKQQLAVDEQDDAVSSYPKPTATMVTSAATSVGTTVAVTPTIHHAMNVSCKPEDPVRAGKIGVCVDTNSADNVCATGEISYSMDCVAFEGSWCCFKPMDATVTSAIVYTQISEVTNSTQSATTVTYTSNPEDNNGTQQGYPYAVLDIDTPRLHRYKSKTTKPDYDYDSYYDQSSDEDLPAKPDESSDTNATTVGYHTSSYTAPLEYKRKLKQYANKLSYSGIHTSEPVYHQRSPTTAPYRPIKVYHQRNPTTAPYRPIKVYHPTQSVAFTSPPVYIMAEDAEDTVDTKYQAPIAESLYPQPNPTTSYYRPITEAVYEPTESAFSTPMYRNPVVEYTTSHPKLYRPPKTSYSLPLPVNGNSMAEDSSEQHPPFKYIRYDDR